MKSQRTIWFINQYASTPETGIAGRHFYIAQELARIGHSVYVIAGSYSHILRKEKEFSGPFYVENIEKNFSVVWIKLDKYKHAHSKKRIINEFIFSKQLMKLPQIILDNPDVVIHSSPALISYYGSKYLSSYYKVPYVFEVRDPWPLTLIEIGGYSKRHPFIMLLQWIEDRAYQEANYALSNFYNAVEHMTNRGMDPNKFSWIPNGLSLIEIEKTQPLPESIASKIPKEKYIIGYTGTLGEANAMSYFIEAASLLKSYSKIHFVIVGDGKLKNDLINKAKDLDNITFLDPIPKVQVQSMLNLFNACYIGWKDMPMYKLGIAANKIPEYMFSAKPVIHSFSGKGDFISQARAGLTVKAEDPEAIAASILELYSTSEIEQKAMGERGKDFVINNLTYNKIARKLEEVLFSKELIK
ncbi:glycosyltransferase family 4 protein [Psychrobacter sanguinis]|uniref:glycosyltransferase family 4 protein n=1 Tax=Psychrobacter sanguinis TaxID=861445 RepID=UPI0028ABDEDA|nr:glycosyltransferase family 4 protein [Psychrobacter sanguinis]